MSKGKGEARHDHMIAFTGRLRAACGDVFPTPSITHLLTCMASSLGQLNLLLIQWERYKRLRLTLAEAYSTQLATWCPTLAPFLSSLAWVTVSKEGNIGVRYLCTKISRRRHWCLNGVSTVLPGRRRGDADHETSALRHIFSKSGYRVALIGRRAEGLNNTAKDINSAGGEVRAPSILSMSCSADQREGPICARLVIRLCLIHRGVQEDSIRMARLFCSRRRIQRWCGILEAVPRRQRGGDPGQSRDERDRCIRFLS
jgi:hypothetical protein